MSSISALLDRMRWPNLTKQSRELKEVLMSAPSVEKQQKKTFASALHFPDALLKCDGGLCLILTFSLPQETSHKFPALPNVKLSHLDGQLCSTSRGGAKN